MCHQDFISYVGRSQARFRAIVEYLDLFVVDFWIEPQAKKVIKVKLSRALRQEETEALGLLYHLLSGTQGDTVLCTE